MQQGSYSIPLLAETPPAVYATCVEAGVIYVTSQWADVDLFGDAAIKTMARYAGPLLRKQAVQKGYVLEGAGMSWYLGGPDGEGPSDLETGITFSSATPTTVLAQAGLLPAAVTAGTVTNTGVSAYSGYHEFESPLDGIRTYSKTVNGHWKVQPDGSLDFSDVDATSGNPYNGGGVTPQVVIVREDFGSDPQYDGLPVASAVTKRDITQYRTRVALIQGREDAEGYHSLVSGSTRGTIPYKDVHGNTLDRTTWLNRSPSQDVDLDQLLATELTDRDINDIQELDTDQYQVANRGGDGPGDLRVGDWMYVYDPAAGFTSAQDTTPIEIEFRGSIIWPKKVRNLRSSWPLADGMGVLYRDVDGTYTNLSRWVRWEA